MEADSHFIGRLLGRAALILNSHKLAMLLMASLAASANASIYITDPKDMGDRSGDIRAIGAYVRGDILYLSMSVDGVAAPSVEQTQEGMVNRYYYHWLIDTDNNPATGRSNAEYEGNATGLANPIGAERVVMIGWRDGKPNGVEIYDALDDDNVIMTGFPYQVSGNGLLAAVPLAVLGLTHGQTIAVSGFQEGASEGWKVDWVESATLTIEGPAVQMATVTDPADMGDSSGDIRSISAYSLGEYLFLSMTVEGLAAPSTENTPAGMVNRYYYHWLIDTDNNPATGRSNAEYEGNSTGVTQPIGTDRVVMIGWRDGKPNGVEVYDPLDDDNVHLLNFPFQSSGNTLTAVVPFSALGISRGQTIAVSAFQEGASESWKVDWMESAELILDGPSPNIAVVADPADMGESSGDISLISGFLSGDNLHLSMTVHGIAAPSVPNTPAGMVNRYYYHWLLDTDNNPATGRSNSEYEGNSTGLSNPIGTERVVMIGWRDGKPNGVEVYDALDDDNLFLDNFPFQASGNTLTAVIPLSALGVTSGQTVGLSAFQEGASEGWKVDWVESENLLLDSGEQQAPVAFVDDPQDMGDSSGDIKRLEATISNGDLVLRMEVYGIILPSVEETPPGMVNRYYYHWLLDTDNNPATGRSNAEYEGNSTELSRPIGYERVVMIGWRDGAPNGLEVYDPLDEDNPLIVNFDYEKLDAATMEVRLPLDQLGLIMGQTIAISAFQEGASEGWKVDWVESAVLTLSEGSGPSISLENYFVGDAYGFELKILDGEDATADENTIMAWIDGTPADVTVNRAGEVTTITGKHSTLLEVDTLTTVRVSLEVDGELQSRDYVYRVEPYTVLPSSGRLSSLDTSNPGFLVYMTQIGSSQGMLGGVHENIAEIAEQQLAGQLVIEGAEEPYHNELDWDLTGEWKGPLTIVEGVINWFSLAPGMDASLNFPDDEAIPGYFGQVAEGVVGEILTYLHLPAGSHKLGLYTEGGHKATAGFTGTGPVLSLFDNSGEVQRVPSYFARNQFFDVVALQDGYYPFRVLWFQTRTRQEPGMLFELFSVKDRALRLINNSSDPLSLRAYVAGVLLDPDLEMPTLQISRSENGLTIHYTGTLEAADEVTGPWTPVGNAGEGTMVMEAEGPAKFLRAVRN